MLEKTIEYELNQFIKKNEQEVINEFRRTDLPYSIARADCYYDKIDSQFNIFLKIDSKPIATSGLSISLEQYYDPAFFEEDSEDFYKLKQIADKTNDKSIITQMQALNNEPDARKGINWRKTMVKFWEKFCVSLGIKRMHYLPAKLNLWNRTEIRDALYSMRHPTASLKVLLQNYDYTAKRCKYKPNLALDGIYEKSIV